MITLDERLRRRLLLQNGLFVVLLLTLAGLLGYLAKETRVQWDVSQNQRNTLSRASMEVLQKLDGPVAVTAYVPVQDAQLGDVRKIVGDLLALYQRVKPDITLTFIDPAEQPRQTREAGVEAGSELVVTFNGRSEHLTAVNEQAFTNLLLRLARADQKLVMALAGHGERRLDGIANHDLGEFGKQLANKGLKTAALNLAIAQEVPANASVLIIASPQRDLLPGEVDKLLAYLARGGNLLWLIDQEPLHGLQPLAEKLALTLTPGVVIDPQAQQLKAPVTFALGTNYGQHAVTRNFNYITVFPFARQIVVNENHEWHSVSLVEAAQRGWVESGEADDAATFDRTYDVAGPVSIAAALSRPLHDREQRVAVVGSGHFLANTYIGNGGNLDFGINLVNWLAGDENLITIQPRATLDGNLTLSQSALTTIVVGFLIALPLAFLASGAIVWWRRRRG